MPSPSSNPKLTMRLIIDTNNEKVLFAETSKPVVDFLFYLLTLPLATVVKLIRNNEDTIGSIENVYQSVIDLDERFMHPQQSKDPLLNPIASISSNEFCNLFPEEDEENMDYEDEGEDEDEDKGDDEDGDEDYEELELVGNSPFHACPNNCSKDVTSDKTSICSEENTSIHDGFVKNKITFLVMDDLVIQPLTSVIEVVNKFDSSKISALEDMVVELGLDEGIKLLKASLQSKKVLTSVFIKKEC